MATAVRALWLTLAVLGGAAIYFGVGMAIGLRPRQFRMQR
jgi:hypothetical protein